MFVKVMTVMKYDAMIFDLYGTLVDNFEGAAYRRVVHMQADIFGIDRLAFWNAWTNEAIRARRFAGAYASFEDAVAGNALPLDFAVNASRVNVRGDTVFAAWHSTDTIQQYGMPDGTEGALIHLQDYDTWVQGLSVTDDDLLVVSAWWPEKRITVFDVRTGTALWTLTNLHVPTEFTGLVCRTH